MSDLPIQGHFQQSHARTVSGEQLEVLGKTAASRYMDGACKTLTDAVTQTVKHAGLSPEQVKRVVEFANTDAFLREFKKEGSGHHVVEFAGGPADPSEILKDLNDGGGGSVFDRGTLDYHLPPGDAKVASAEAELAFEQMFAVQEQALPFAEPLGEAMDMRDKLASLTDHLTSELTGLEGMFHDLSDRLYFQVKQAALEGHPLGHISEVMSAGGQGPEIMKCAFMMITPRLLKDEVFRTIGQAMASMDKTASAVIVNRHHPLVAETREFGECLTKMAHIRAARDQANEHYGQITHFIKCAKGAAEHVVEKAVSGAKKLAPHAGHVASSVKKHVIGGTGEGTRKVVEGLVEKSPHLVGAGLALEGARRLSNDPTARKVYHGAQAHLNPASEDWQVETMRQRGEI